MREDLPNDGELIFRAGQHGRGKDRGLKRKQMLKKGSVVESTDKNIPGMISRYAVEMDVR